MRKTRLNSPLDIVEVDLREGSSILNDSKGGTSTPFPPNLPKSLYFFQGTVFSSPIDDTLPWTLYDFQWE